MAIREVNLMDSMRVIEGFVYCKVKKTGFVDSMLIAKRMNPVFLDLMCITGTRFNHNKVIFPTKCHSSLVHHFILGGNVKYKA